MSAETEFQRILESKLDKLYAERRDQLAFGVCRFSASTEEDYSHRTGYLMAIRDVGEMCKEIAKSMTGNGEREKKGDTIYFD